MTQICTDKENAGTLTVTLVLSLCSKNLGSWVTSPFEVDIASVRLVRTRRREYRKEVFSVRAE
jgi:hypothetical protein